jgi:hypothetical protein
MYVILQIVMTMTIRTGLDFNPRNSIQSEAIRRSQVGAIRSHIRGEAEDWVKMRRLEI